DPVRRRAVRYAPAARLSPVQRRGWHAGGASRPVAKAGPGDAPGPSGPRGGAGATLGRAAPTREDAGPGPRPPDHWVRGHPRRLAPLQPGVHTLLSLPRREPRPHGRRAHGGRGRSPDGLPPGAPRPRPACPAHRRRGEPPAPGRPRRRPPGHAPPRAEADEPEPRPLRLRGPRAARPRSPP